jgi:3-phosphoshikimate 1-carboxyvinyltransferase
MDGNSSSQYFTSILQVAPLFKNGLTLEVTGELVSKPYLDITMNEMKKFGVEVTNENYKRFIVKPQVYTPVNMTIEGDASAMSYFAAFVVLHGGEIRINNLSHESKQGDYHFIDELIIF